MLALVGWYEALHNEKPPSAKDIADEVAKLLGGATILRPELPPPQEAPANQEAPFPNLEPLQSKLTKIIFVCHRRAGDFSLGLIR
jgi:hypothetical protein